MNKCFGLVMFLILFLSAGTVLAKEKVEYKALENMLRGGLKVSDFNNHEESAESLRKRYVQADKKNYKGGRDFSSVPGSVNPSDSSSPANTGNNDNQGSQPSNTGESNDQGFSQNQANSSSETEAYLPPNILPSIEAGPPSEDGTPQNQQDSQQQIKTEGLEGNQDDLATMSKEDAERLQNSMQTNSQTERAASNLLKKSSDTENTVKSNMKGN